MICANSHPNEWFSLSLYKLNGPCCSGMGLHRAFGYVLRLVTAVKRIRLHLLRQPPSVGSSSPRGALAGSDSRRHVHTVEATVAD